MGPSENDPPEQQLIGFAPFISVMLFYVVFMCDVISMYLRETTPGRRCCSYKSMQLQETTSSWRCCLYKRLQETESYAVPGVNIQLEMLTLQETTKDWEGGGCCGEIFSPFYRSQEEGGCRQPSLAFVLKQRDKEIQATSPEAVHFPRRRTGKGRRE